MKKRNNGVLSVLVSSSLLIGLALYTFDVKAATESEARNEAAKLIWDTMQGEMSSEVSPGNVAVRVKTSSSRLRCYETSFLGKKSEYSCDWTVWMTGADRAIFRYDPYNGLNGTEAIELYNGLMARPDRLQEDHGYVVQNGDEYIDRIVTSSDQVISCRMILNPGAVFNVICAYIYK